MLHQKHPRLKIVETQRSLKDLAINYPGMRRLGEEKAWAQNMMERFGVVLAHLSHLRRVQDGQGGYNVPGAWVSQRSRS